MRDQENLGAQIRVEGRADGTFEPEPGGDLCYILNVDAKEGDTIDYVAWPVANELIWWRRHGLGMLLGERALFIAGWMDEPVILWKTPADWLRAELGNPGHHCCLLDWSCDPRAVFRRVGEVQCMGEAVRARLSTRIAECAAAGFKIAVAHDGR